MMRDPGVHGTLQSLDGWLRQARIEPIVINRSASN
jgi:hypothetical protein